MTRTSVGVVQPKGFVEVLEGRLQHLQVLVQDHESSIHEQETAFNPGSVAEEMDANEASRNESQIRSEPISRQDHAEGRSRRHSPEIGLLSLSAMAEPNSRATEFLKGISIPGIISAVTETFGGNPQSTTRMDALWDGIAKNIRRPTLDAPDRLILPEEDALEYVSTYYKVVDYRYPSLPKEAVMRGIMAITASQTTEYEATLAQEPATMFMAYMVLAITPLVSDTYPVAQASFISIHILSKALKILDKVFQHEDGVDVIYCLMLLIIFSFHSSAAGSTWQLTGIMMKNLVSSALDRPFGINDGDITIEGRDPLSLQDLALYSADTYTCIDTGYCDPK
ncbi:hypothetical protein IFR04_016239 [Cadophora malorum]|uniref:Uncharacterized protein n=1 Tax=Cadophora malorum TaxID=108018 RepID=A0A8H7T072_9HELO|nr:hypothetical protein IFR04_016239 [Cadophora malorum]